MGIASLHPSYDERDFATSRRVSPEVCMFVCPLEDRGRREDRVALHPRSRVQLRTPKTHTSIQVQREHPGLPCAVALRLTSCSPRWTALLPPSFLRNSLLKNLTPAPRRQDHTTSPYAFRTLVLRTLRVHRIPPHVRDDRDRPSSAV